MCHLAVRETAEYLSDVQRNLDRSYIVEVQQELLPEVDQHFLFVR